MTVTNFVTPNGVDNVIRVTVSNTVTTCSNASTNPLDCDFLRLPKGFDGSNKQLTPQTCFQHRIIGFGVAGEGYVWGPYNINDLRGVGMLDIDSKQSLLHVEFITSRGQPTSPYTFSGPVDLIRHLYNHIIFWWALMRATIAPVLTIPPNIVALFLPLSPPDYDA